MGRFTVGIAMLTRYVSLIGIALILTNVDESNCAPTSKLPPYDSQSIQQHPVRLDSAAHALGDSGQTQLLFLINDVNVFCDSFTVFWADEDKLRKRMKRQDEHLADWSHTAQNRVEGYAWRALELKKSVPMATKAYDLLQNLVLSVSWIEIGTATGDPTMAGKSFKAWFSFISEWVMFVGEYQRDLNDRRIAEIAKVDNLSYDELITEIDSALFVATEMCQNLDPIRAQISDRGRRPIFQTWSAIFKSKVKNLANYALDTGHADIHNILVGLSTASINIDNAGHSTDFRFLDQACSWVASCQNNWLEYKSKMNIK